MHVRRWGQDDDAIASVVQFDLTIEELWYFWDAANVHNIEQGFLFIEAGSNWMIAP